MKEKILKTLSPDYPWADRFHYVPETGSTNDDLKALAKAGAPHGTAILAGSQTGGHGRLGRSFHSPEGMGLYMSILLRPECAPTELMHLTCAAAVAMCDAVEDAADFRPGIKWTNDLVHGKRKLGGILTELALNKKGMVDYIIVGIGINVCQQEGDFPAELREMAGSLEMASGKPLDPAPVAAAMLENLHAMSCTLLSGSFAMLRQYRRDCVTLGQDISILRGDQVTHGHALDIDGEGALIVRFPDGSTGTVNSGEVSVRGMYGYL